ncbi:MAG: hypothetical protein V1746_03855, partial [bacterium]
MNPTALKKFFLFSFFALIFGAALLQAADAPASANPPMSPWMQKHDINKDGKVDDKERAAMQKDAQERSAKMRTKWLEEYDKNKDGKLDDDEKAAMKKEREAAREKKILEKYDKNKDGKL